MSRRGTLGLPGQWLGYFLVTALASLSGLIFLPWHARVLNLADYGTLQIGETALAITSVLVTAGLPQAVVRLLPRYGKERFGATVQIGHVMLCAMAFVLSLLVLPLCPVHLRPIYLLFAGLAVLNSMFEVASSFLRAEQSVLRFGLALVFMRYLPVLTGLLAYRLAPSLPNLLASRLLMSLGAVVLAYVLTRIVPTVPSLDLFREALTYGAPLIALALSSAILSVGDRFVVKVFAGQEAVAIYAAAYGLANGLVALLIAPFNLLVQPAYMRKWETEGPVATQAFLNQTFAWYLLIVCPAVVCLAFGSPRLVVLLLGSTYSEGTFVIPIVGLGVAVYGAYFVTGAGLFLKKATAEVGRSIALMAGMNLALNCILVPLAGILGAAISTLITYVGFVSVVSVKAFSTMPVKVSPGILRAVALEAIFSALLFASITHAVSGWIGLIIGGSAVVLSCLIIVAIFARELIPRRLQRTLMR